MRLWGSCLRLWKCVRTFVYAFEPSVPPFLAQGSNERLSAQHSRSNLQSIYHKDFQANYASLTTFGHFMGSHQSLSKNTLASESAKLCFMASGYAFFQRHFMVLVTTPNLNFLLFLAIRMSSWNLTRVYPGQSDPSTWKAPARPSGERPHSEPVRSGSEDSGAWRRKRNDCES